MGFRHNGRSDLRTIILFISFGARTYRSARPDDRVYDPRRDFSFATGLQAVSGG